MTEVICLQKNYLLIIFCVLIGMAVWYNHYDKKQHTMEKDYKFNDSVLTKIVKKVREEDNIKQQVQVNRDNREIDDIERRKYLNQRDAMVLYNDLAPPERRVPEYQYPYNYVKAQLNIPTRGLPENYQIMGVLLRDETETAYNLFGRQTYPGSNQWEYYAQRTEKEFDVKLPIRVRGDKEIMEHEHVHIPGTDPKKGPFKVKLYRFDAPRYIPLPLQ